MRQTPEELKAQEAKLNKDLTVLRKELEKGKQEHAAQVNVAIKNRIQSKLNGIQQQINEKSAELQKIQTEMLTLQ